ncbi:hypothetical protein ACQP3C_26240, partial [Escherichia coli]
GSSAGFGSLYLGLGTVRGMYSILLRKKCDLLKENYLKGLRLNTAFAENWSSVPSTHIRSLTTTYL